MNALTEDPSQNESAHQATTEQEYIGMLVSDESTINPSSSGETNNTSMQENTSFDTSINTTAESSAAPSDYSFTAQHTIEFRRRQFDAVSRNPLYQPPPAANFNSAEGDDIIPAEHPFEEPHPSVPNQQLLCSHCGSRK